MDIFNLRREFTQKELDENEVASDPITQFKQWFNEALESKSLEPNAMVLSTSTPNGKPSSRVVLLKQIKPEGFIFFTNYESCKGTQLKKNPYCSLNFMWHELERQVRIEGIAKEISSEESDSYFEIRPLKSKLGAWTSPQSQVIKNREYLNNIMEDFEKQFSDKKIIRPYNWGGYLIEPTSFEFWQGRENRLHDRIRYRIKDNRWIVERLAP